MWLQYYKHSFSPSIPFPAQSFFFFQIHGLLFISKYIKYNLLNVYNATCMYVFRAVHLVWENQLVWSSPEEDEFSVLKHFFFLVLVLLYGELRTPGFPLPAFPGLLLFSLFKIFFFFKNVDRFFSEYFNRKCFLVYAMNFRVSIYLTPTTLVTFLFLWQNINRSIKERYFIFDCISRGIELIMGTEERQGSNGSSS